MSKIITHGDLINPFLADKPVEWVSIPPEMYEKLVPRRGFLLKSEREQLDKILKADYLLLKNMWNWKCSRCGNIHEYFTLMCIERPFNRLSAIHGLIKDKERAKEGDLILNGISLGTIIPITQKEAETLRWKIRFKGYPI